MQENIRASCSSALTKGALKEDMDLAAEAIIAMVEAAEPPVPNNPPATFPCPHL